MGRKPREDLGAVGRKGTELSVRPAMVDVLQAGLSLDPII